MEAYRILCSLPTTRGNLELTLLAGEVQDCGSVCGVLLHMEKNNAIGAEAPDTPSGNH